MSIELGHFLLFLNLALSAGATLIGFAFWRSERVLPLVQQISIISFFLVSLSFLSLIQAFVVSDFSLKLAHDYSHSLQPLIYKITSVWGNHEGSMLLWILILVGFGAAVAAFGRRLPHDLLNLVLATQALLVTAFTGFLIFTSNPFERIAFPPIEGNDLNPVLQDLGLAIHPPLLYVGYVGLSICFSFAVAALISGRIDAAWARWVRPWTLASWIFLTLGIAMGSYWAYYELGWGGWWFWDPVENASFMPWLAATALLHSALVMEKRNALKVWTVFLAIVAFSLSLLGTFLVRSGILTSVHSFASDPARGLVILGILAAVIGGAFVLFAMRASALRQGGIFAPVSREGALVLNNLFLATALIAVLVGTLYPLALDALTGQLISVGAPFFDLTFSALMVPLLLLLPFGPYLPWKRADLMGIVQRMGWVFGATIIAWIFLLILARGLHGFTALGLLTGAWICIGAAFELADRAHIGKTDWGTSFARLKGLPKNAWSTAIAHFGVGVTVLGIVCVSAFEREEITTLFPGQSLQISGYEVELKSISETQGPNFAALLVDFEITDPANDVAFDRAEKRLYQAQNMPSTEASINTYGFSQLYLSVGDQMPSGAFVVRAWHKPFVTLIWIGALIMSFGGLVSLSDRRLRIGMPNVSKKKSTSTSTAQSSGQGV